MMSEQWPNLLLQDVQYKVDETRFGVWRRFVYPDGQLFEEFTSHQRLIGLPLVHYTRGKCPETGKRLVAKGVVAIGRLAVGILAIGHASAGVVAIGQLGLGLVFGLGQASTGMLAIGQLAIAAEFGLGQISTGWIAIGQIAFGRYVLAQFGIGQYVWDMRGASPVAREFFRGLIS
jgi:hypothetical protein